MKAYLFTSQNARTEISEYFLIGQDEGCHWVVPTASPRQAKIEFHNNQFVLKDLRSETGTFLNDQRIQEAFLQEGDWIRIDEEERMFSVKAERDKPSFTLKSRNVDWNQKLQRLGSASQTDFSILILGPSGSGKEIIAQSIHKGSKRSKGPFVSVNCSALSENLIESELFGHLKGSFTGALVDRKGAFESARGGTLFLDEIGDLPLNLQAKLLRALENEEIRPVGSDINIQTDVRIIAATHQNLIEKIQNQEFRSDLYYRLNVLCIETPTLYDRPEDFEELLYGFAKQMKVRFSFTGIERLKKHSWPGNIRELKNTVARAAALYPRETIYAEQVEFILDKLSLGPKAQPIANSLGVPLPAIKEMERQMILKRLASNNGNQRQTALDLGLPKSTLHDRLRAYNIDPRTYSKFSSKNQPRV
jgi:DNA-binding NtrC family response regulator